MNLTEIYNRIVHILPTYTDTPLRVDAGFLAVVDDLARIFLPALAIFLLVRCLISLFRGKTPKEVWGYLEMPDGGFAPLRHWENLLGKSKSADVRTDYPSVSRSHAVLSRLRNGKWRLAVLDKKSVVLLNGQRVTEKATLDFGDVITLGEVEFKLIAPAKSEVMDDCQNEKELPAAPGNPLLSLILLSVFQLVSLLMLMLHMPKVNPVLYAAVFGLLLVAEWGYYLFMLSVRRTGFEVEFLAFFLTSLGFVMTGSAAPGSLIKQMFAFLAGLIVYLLLGLSLRSLGRSRTIRWIMAGICVALLLASFLFAKEVNGARNWLFIGPISVQPSEFAKICFIYAGAATLEQMRTRRNLILYILLAFVSALLLALTNDFGTAAVFFVTFIVVAFLRSGDIATILLSIAGAGIAGLSAVTFKPYVLNRFKAWRHAWEYPSDLGYQQTRVMAFAASGGLLGLGLGNGWLKHLAAADTDLVFGMLCEEYGILIAICAVLCIAAMAGFAVRSARSGRSTFYTVAAVSATAMMAFQTLLNVCGAVDILPLTGVTFPFVSDGGSSMICSWGLLAFIKAADLRPGASFAIKRLRPEKERRQKDA